MTQSSVRILQIGPYPIAGRVFGGVEAVVGSLAPALARQPGVERVDVLSFHRGRSASSDERPANRLHIYRRIGQRRLVVLTHSLLAVQVARRAVAALRPDIVHGHGLGMNGDVATHIWPRAVVTVHGMIHQEARLAPSRGVRDTLRIALIDRMVARVMGRAGLVISIAPTATRSLEPLIHGHIVNIPNPIDAAFFAPPQPYPTAPCVVFAGVIGQRKNILGLVAAFAIAKKRAPAARLVIAGPILEEAYAAAIRSRIAQLGLNSSVEMTGHLSYDQLIDTLDQAQVVALFSNDEVLPTIISQAQARARPVVATCVGGIPEMINNGEQGLLIPVGDIEACGLALRQLLDDAHLAQQMGVRGRELARDRYSAEAVAQQTLAAYQRVR